MRIGFFLILIGFVPNLLGQVSENMTLGSNWTDDNLPTSSGVRYNDIWGYVDCDGNEYAILGSAGFTHFINVSDPDNVTEVNRFQGTVNSIWRDFKTYKTFAYGVADQGNEGLSIFDLSALPNSVSMVSMDNSVFGRAHNIFIDEPNHRLYVAGANNGLIVYDLSQNPANPDLLGVISLTNGGGYVHDVYVRNNIAYCSHGWDGYYIWDFSSVSNPQILASVPTNGYNHSSWVTDDNQYAIIAEEVPAGLPLLVIDISGMFAGDIEIVKDFKEPLLAPIDEGNTPHNPFIRGNHLVVSYYEDGVQVFDISNPLNPDRIAYYDTAPNNTNYNGTRNNWGTYPFLPSGTILGSDTQFGLFVLKPDYAGIAPIGFDTNPNLSWVDDSDIESCSDALVSLAVNSDAESLIWQIDNVPNPNLMGNQIEASESGMYSVVGTNGKCSVELSPLSVNLNGQVNVTFIGLKQNSLLLCDDETSLLEIPAGADMYEWTRNGEIINNTENTLIVSEAGSYQVTASTGDCTATSSTIEVAIATMPNVVFNQSTTIVLCEGQNISLEIAAGAEAYEWQKDDEVLSETSNILQINEAGIYQVMASNGNCTATSELVTVSIIAAPDVSLNQTEAIEICEGETLILEIPSGADSYIWTQNDEVLAENTNLLVVSQSGNYQVSARNGDCTLSSQSIEVLVNSVPNVSLNQTGQIDLCDGGTAILSVAADAQEYVWYQNNSVIPNENSNQIEISETGDYQVIASNGNCANTSEIISISASNNSGTIEILSPLSVEICSGEFTTISATEGANSYTWDWDGWIIPSQNSANLTIDAPGNYFVTANFNGCTAVSTQVQVSIVETPNVNLNTGDVTLCENENFTIEIPNTSATYQWFLGDNPIINETGNTLVVASEGNYSVQANNGNCSLFSNTISVSLGNTIDATIFSDEVIDLCVGESINLQTNQGADNYIWTLNGSPIVGENTFSVAANQAGIYQVTALLGACPSMSQNIQINTINIPNTTLNTSENIVLCNGESTTLEIEEGAESYQWFLDENPINGAILNTYEANQAGTYMVEASNGSCSATSTNTTLSFSESGSISINNINGNDFIICPGESITLEASGGANYAWSTGDMTATTTVSPSIPTFYTVVDFLNTECIEGATIYVDVIELSTPILEGNSEICEGENTVLSTKTIADNYTWTLNGEIIEGENTNSIEASHAGNYVLTTTIAECSAASSNLLLSLATAPNVEGNLGNPLALCEGEDFILEVPQGAASYEWFLDGQSLSGENSNTLLVNSNGAYSVLANNGNCAAMSETTIVSVNQIPDANILQPTTNLVELCENESTIISVSEGAENYLWTLNGQVLENEANASLEANQEGLYQVEISNTACIATSETIEISFIETPNASINIEADNNEICEGSSTIISTSKGADNYFWILNGSTLANHNEATLEIQEAGTYQVSLQSNGCEILSEAIELTVIPQPNVELNVVDTEITICANDTFLLSVPDETENYQWYLNSNPISQTNHSISISETGNYQVIANNGICQEISNIFSLTVLAEPDTSFLEPVTACDNNPTTVSIDDGNPYVWTLNGEIIDNPSNELIISEPGDYAAVLFQDGCPVLINHVVLHNATSPNTNILADALVFCEGDSIQINASEDAESYAWYQDGQLLPENSTTLTVFEAGNYHLVAANASCEMNTDTLDIETFETNIPTIAINGNSLTTEGAQSYQWYFNGELMEGSTNISLDIKESGNYFVEIVDENNCLIQSEMVFVLYSSLEEIDPTLSIQAFPNPVSNTLFIDIKSDFVQDISIEINNVIGQQLFFQEQQINIQKERIAIPVQNWASGIYVLTLNSKNGKWVEKIVVE